MAKTDKGDEKPVTRKSVMLVYDPIEITTQAISSAKIHYNKLLY